MQNVKCSLWPGKNCIRKLHLFEGHIIYALNMLCGESIQTVIIFPYCLFISPTKADDTRDSVNIEYHIVEII